jgi:RNA polymerase sigma-70 factor (ECF subfamily)
MDERAMNDELKTRPSLLLRVRNLQDQRSWNEFLELYGPLILRYLRHLGLSPDDALDLSQDVLHIVTRRVKTFEYDEGRSFRAWLRTVTKNRALRQFREKSRRLDGPGGTTHHQVVQELPSPDDEQDEWIENEWRRRRLEMAVKRVRLEVEPQTWRIFEMRYYEQKSSKQVAEELGTKQGTVDTACCRVRQRLRKALEEIDE